MEVIDINILRNRFHKVYKDIIDELYSDNYKSNQDAYPFYKIENCDFTIVYNNTKYLNSLKSLLLISLKTDKEIKVQEIYVENEYTLSEIQDFSSQHELISNLINRIELGNEIVRLDLSHVSKDIIFKNQEFLFNFLQREILDYRKEFNKVMNLSNKSLSTREYNNRYQFTKYSIDEVIKYFALKNQDNAEQLEILFEQSMFCYENNKYLASAACIGVAIEELCILILEECGFDSNIRDKNTTIVELAGIIRKRGIIDRRLSSQLVASAIIRNSVSHSSSGYVSADQCNILISSFKSLFDSYIKYTITKK